MSTVFKQGIQPFDTAVTILDSLHFDDHGFLIETEEWSAQVAIAIAELDGVAPLTEKHWEVITLVRKKYLELGAMPPVRGICRRSSLSRAELKSLFGSCLEVWRIAGLPDPGQEALNYMS